MTIRRVFIAWTNSLFYRSVRLLLNHPDVAIVGASQESETVWNVIRELRPDTIILERREEMGEETPNLDLDNLWSNGAWNSRVILAGMRDNTAQIYYCEEHVLEQAGDLLQLVLDE